MRLFVSYSRRDSMTADALVTALEARDYQVVIDRRDLPFGEQWQAELAEFIRSCDTVIWLVSADSVRSRWCRWELGEVQRAAKRLVPVRIGAVDIDALPEELGKIHCLPAVGTYRSAEHFETLCQTLDTDRNWIREHTRLADRAREWNNAGKVADRMLRGHALRDAEAWAEARPPRVPPPTAEVVEYLVGCRGAAQRRARRLLWGSLAVTGLTSALAVFAWLQRDAAIDNQGRAERQAEISDGLRRNAQATAVRTAEQRSGLLAGMVDRNDDPLLGTLIALEAWSGPGGEFAGFDALDRFRAAGGAEDDSVPILTVDELGAIPDYSDVVGRIVARLHQLRERHAFGDWEQGKLWAFAPAGRRLAVLQDNGAGGHVWNVDTGDVQAHFSAAGEKIEDLALSADGHLLAAGTDGGRLLCWDARTGVELVANQLGSRAIDPVAFVGSSHRLAFGAGRRGAVVDLDAAGDDPEWLNTTGILLEGLERRVSRFATTADGQRLIAAVEDGRILTWDAASCRRLHEIETGRSGRGLSISEDGSRAAAYIDIGRVAVWRADTGEVLYQTEEQMRVDSFALGGDGRLLCFARADGKVVVHTIDGDVPDRVLSAETGRIDEVLLVAAPPMVVASFRDGRVCVWPRHETWPSLTLHLDERGSVDNLAWDAETGQLLGMSYWGPARLWAIDEHPPMATLETGSVSASQLMFSTDGRLLIGYTPARAGLVVWSMDTRQRLFETPDVRVLTPFAFMSDGTSVVATAAGRAWLVSLTDGGRRAIAALNGVRADTALLTWDRTMAVVSDTEHGVAFAGLGPAARPVSFSEPTRGAILFAASCEDAGLLATTSQQGDVDVWRLGTGEHLQRIDSADGAPLGVEWTLSGDALQVPTMTGKLRRFPVVHRADGATLGSESDGEQSARVDDAAFGIVVLPGTGWLSIADLGLGQRVWRQPRQGMPGYPATVSSGCGLVAEWVEDAAGSRVLLHQLPDIVSRMVAPRGRARGLVAATRGGSLSPAELRFWQLERQRHVFDVARQALPRRLDAFERERFGLGPEPGPLGASGR